MQRAIGIAYEWMIGGDAFRDAIARALMEERRAERERCAKIADEIADAADAAVALFDDTYANGAVSDAAHKLAAAIRGQP